MRFSGVFYSEPKTISNLILKHGSGFCRWCSLCNIYHFFQNHSRLTRCHYKGFCTGIGNRPNQYLQVMRTYADIIFFSTKTQLKPSGRWKIFEEYSLDLRASTLDGIHNKTPLKTQQNFALSALLISSLHSLMSLFLCIIYFSPSIRTAQWRLLWFISSTSFDSTIIYSIANVTSFRNWTIVFICSWDWILRGIQIIQIMFPEQAFMDIASNMIRFYNEWYVYVNSLKTNKLSKAATNHTNDNENN